MLVSPTPPKDLFLTGTLLGPMPVGGAHLFSCPMPSGCLRGQVSTGTPGKLADAWEGWPGRAGIQGCFVSSKQALCCGNTARSRVFPCSPGVLVSAFLIAVASPGLCLRCVGKVPSLLPHPSFYCLSCAFVHSFLLLSGNSSRTGPAVGNGAAGTPPPAATCLPLVAGLHLRCMLGPWFFLFCFPSTRRARCSNVI